MRHNPLFEVLTQISRKDIPILIVYLDESILILGDSGVIFSFFDEINVSNQNQACAALAS